MAIHHPPDPTRLAVIGAGNFARFVCEAIEQAAEIEVVAVTDTDLERARSMTSDLGVPARDLPDVLADPAVDAVLIATPPATHAPLTLDALAAGKDVFCEKPLGVTPEQAEAVHAAAAAGDRVVVVDHVLRYNPLLRAVRRLQDQLQWRPIRFLFENDAADESLPSSHWFWDESQSGGIFVEHGVHFFDAATMFIDEPATQVVATSTRRTGWPSPDIVTATVTHGDCLATHTHSFTHAHSAERQLMRIDYGCAEARIRGWIPVEATVDILTDDDGLQRLLDIVYDPGYLAAPSGRAYTPTVELSVDHRPSPVEARGRGVAFPASHHVRLSLGLGGEPAKPAVYAAGVAAALRDLHACRTNRRQQPRSGPGTAADAVRTACAAAESDRTGSRVLLATTPRLSSCDIREDTMTTGPVHFPLGPFTPYQGNPILAPQGEAWESRSVYNPAAIVVDDKVALLYRAHADDIVSHVGLAWSDDGIKFEREPDPVLSPSEDYDRYGVEDPRVTRIDDTYYLTYSGWDRETALLCLATSTDLRNWTKHGPMFPDFDTFQPAGHGRPGPWSKAGGIVAEPFDGKYLMYFGEGSIWAATSEDLLHWTPITPDDEPPVMAPRPNTFTDFLVEVGPPPLITDDGLILLVHNAAIKNPDGTVRYTAGQILIDPARPTEILAELTRPWIEPTTFEEMHGLVSNVTFVEGLVWFQDQWFAYYGQSDSTLGVATFRPGERHSDLGSQDSSGRRDHQDRVSA